MIPKWAWGITVTLITLLISYNQITAQEGLVDWSRYNVVINVQENSGVTIEEDQEVALASGATIFKRVIPTDKVEDINVLEIVELSPDGIQHDYQLADSGAEYTYQVLSGNRQKTIQIHFPPNTVPRTKFLIKYFVVGGIGFYDDGDQFEWQPFGNSAAAPIANANTLVKLPAQLADNEVIRSSTGVETEQHFSGDVVNFIAKNVAPNDTLKISVKIPSGIIAGSPPSWQRSASFNQMLAWGSAILGLLLLFFIPLIVFAWWYFKVRIPPDSGKKIPKYIKSPPSKLSPAVAGALLDGKTTGRHITATMLDLATRGALKSEDVPPEEDKDENEEENKNKKVEAQDFYVYNVDQKKATRSYEATLYSKLFSYAGEEKNQLLGNRRAIYMAVPNLKDQIDLEIAKAGFIPENREVIRRQYVAFGGAGIMISIILGLLAVIALGQFTYLIACPFLSITMGAVALIMVGLAAPSKTKLGQKHAVRWESFRRYLKDITKKEASQNQARFSQLLPYAVTFGLEKSFVEKFSDTNTPIPQWWGKPEEIIPDTSNQQAYHWISENDTPEQPAAEQNPKGVRRLKESTKEMAQKNLLKQNLPTFKNFLAVALDVFGKAPPIDVNEGVDFDSLA